MNVDYNDATLEVRRLLSEAGHDIKCYSEYHTLVVDGAGNYWDLSDDLYGKLDASTSVKPDMFLKIIERINMCNVKMRTKTDENGVGRSWCDLCGGTVGKHYVFCPWCGARFDG